MAFLKDIIWKDIPENLWHDWKWQIANRLSGEDGLKRLPFLSLNKISRIKKVIQKFKWASTPYYLGLIDIEDSKDPIKLQVIPDEQELEVACSLSCPDPMAEADFTPVKGLIHRYHDRALILTTNFCASYCRHCNRKRTWKRNEAIDFSKDCLSAVNAYLRAHPEIAEVILSGGDPLTLSLDRLCLLLEMLKAVSSIKVIRIGTRLPVVLPMAITQELCKVLKKFRPIWINTHFNHPSEITPEALAAVERIQQAGIPVANQTVLLRKVNDSEKVLKELFLKLHAAMIRPYYLFNCDYVEGTDHFRVEIERGIRIVESLWGKVSGMCIPNYVVDLPDGKGKARLLPSHLIKNEDKFYYFSTFEGQKVKIPKG